jgi:predicted nucleic acid-binding protein
MIVLDANILIRAVLGKRVRLLLETYTTRRIRFYAPEVAYADAAKYREFSARMLMSETQRLKAIEDENRRLKLLVAELNLHGER